MITASFNQDRSNLILTVDLETQEYLREEEQNNDDFHSDNFMFDFMEGFIGNNEYVWIAPETCGDLTSAPMLGILSEEEPLPEGAGQNGSGWVISGPNLGHQVTERWAWMMYQIQSLQGELAQKGKVILVS